MNGIDVFAVKMPASHSLRILSVKNNFHSYMEGLSCFDRAVTKIENFNRANYITICNNFEEYVSGVPQRSRIRIVWMTRIATIIYTLRFYLAIITNNPIKLYLLDISPMLCHPILMQSANGTVCLAILAIGMTVIYQEQTHTTHLLELFYLINKGFIRYPLKNYNFRKYAIRVNFGH